jgi:hypothetical protein
VLVHGEEWHHESHIADARVWVENGNDAEHNVGYSVGTRPAAMEARGSRRRLGGKRGEIIGTGLACRHRNSGKGGGSRSCTAMCTRFAGTDRKRIRSGSGYTKG